MSESEKRTEVQILEAARKIFVEKGFEGARMQEIADKAGINKALLHYYYRSKEKLFEAVFQESFQKIVPRIFEIMDSSAPLTEKIESFVSSYIDLLAENPHIPSFVLHELYRNPDRIGKSLLHSGVDPKLLLNRLAEQMRNENCSVIEPQQLIVNLIAVCVFPFVARPILQKILFDCNPEQYRQFLASRKAEVTRFILNALKPS